jgi:hypothetical protein
MVVSGDNSFADTDADQDQTAHFEWRALALQTAQPEGWS